MLSVNEGYYQKEKASNSFIPYDLKSTNSQLLLRMMLFLPIVYRILQRAEQITLVYNTENDEFGSGEKADSSPNC